MTVSNQVRRLQAALSVRCTSREPATICMPPVLVDGTLARAGQIQLIHDGSRVETLNGVTLNQVVSAAIRRSK